MIEKSRKQVIFEESAILFNNKGYNATSMQDIAENIGIRASSLYNHIQSKQEILSSLLIEIAHKFYDGSLEIQNSSKSYKNKLEEIIVQHIRISTDNQHITSLIVNDWKYLEEPFLTEYINLRNGYQEILENILSAGMKNGEFKNADVKTIINMVLFSLRWIYNPKLYSKSDSGSLEKTILESIFTGISK